MELSEIAKYYYDLQTQHETLKKELKELEEKWTEVEIQLQEAMVNEGVNTIKLAGVGTFMMKTKNYLSVTAANKEQFFPYLQESGNGGLLKLDVNSRTLSAFLGEHVEQLKAEKMAKGVDEVTARNEAIEFLKSKGASAFSERGIALKKG